ncbi:hypothetical protein BDF14DRAFT_1975296 [Spinellus fusiger]|nr:hypothetical protein BDF14DRAFT_1975296 [Spinellus fusiger]
MSHPKTVQATRENIESLLKDDIKVKVAAVDIDGVLRGKVMHKSKFLQSLDNGFGFCSILFGWDIKDTLYTTPKDDRVESEFGDLIAMVDITTYRRIPWENNIAVFLLYLVQPTTLQPVPFCPRTLIKSVADELSTQGLKAYCGIEYEFYCFKETTESLEKKGYSNLIPLTLGMCGYSILRPSQNQEFYDNAFNWLADLGIDIEGWHTETGPGVFEAALAYDEVVSMADKASLFKTSMKQIAMKHGFMASFMAKPYQSLPGCSGHIHMSIKNNEGRNLFAPVPGEESEVEGMSHIMVWFIAGILRGLPSILAILAPTVNSYKRLVENYWAPVTVSWSIGGRAGAIRAILSKESPQSNRIELRVPGADINPQLAMAAILKCGYWGIKTHQKLPVPSLTQAKDGIPSVRLARTLQEAVIAMEDKASIARVVLGDVFVDHYVDTRKHEWNLWQNAVTDYELKRYMEII